MPEVKQQQRRTRKQQPKEVTQEVASSVSEQPKPETQQHQRLSNGLVIVYR